MQSRTARQSGTGHGTHAAERIDVFPYPADPNAPASSWNGWMDVERDGDAEETAKDASTAWDQRLQEETRRALEAGREQGRQEERRAQAAVVSGALEQQKRQMAGMAESFALARDRYLQAVEREVVRLALAVAARILRREAQMDPLLLTGAVRVALGQLAASTEVKLRVPASELGLWTETMALLPNLPVKPEVVAGEGLRLGECVIESKVGTVDLGLRAQLAEIERGFFDRAAPPDSVTADAGRA
jgi:flagellar assembly protein FliH